MKLGEGGEAFFVFETSDEIPEELQTSPLISPTSSPRMFSAEDPSSAAVLQEPDYLDLTRDASKQQPIDTPIQVQSIPLPCSARRDRSDVGRSRRLLLRSMLNI